jgi:hypothetical protein
VSGSYAYVADDYYGLQVVDVSNPAFPAIAGGVDTPGYAHGVAVSGNSAYVADWWGGLQVVDVSNPASPAIVGSVKTPGWAQDVAVSGSYAYVADAGGLQVVGVSDPTSPQIVGSVKTPGWAQDVAVSGSYAYVADGSGGLQVVDVSNPVSPLILGSVNTPGEARGVAVAGSYAYVADHTGLQIVPAQCEEPIPVLLSGFRAEIHDQNVLLSWFTSFEYLHDGFNVYRSRVLTSGYARLNEDLVRGRSPYSYLDRAVQPGTTYFYKLGAVDSRGGEVTHLPTSVTTPAWGIRTELRLASPSPFRKETVLHFTLAKPSKARLAVYDVAGRLVRVLIDDELQPRDHDTKWDGRSDAGLRVSGGTYFVKLTAGDETQTRKVIFLGER